MSAVPSAANPETSGFSISTSTRVGAQAGYYRHWQPSEGYAANMNWNGNVSTSNPGSISNAFLDDTLRRINYFRAQAGLESDITLNATKNARSQWSALMTSRQAAISHTPAITWPTSPAVLADIAAHGGLGWGHEAAGLANLAYGYYGPTAIDFMMHDPGTANGAAGHRRWFLYPIQQEMGIGSIPTQSDPFASSLTVWVQGEYKTPGPATNKIVAWPNEGFIPYPITPNSSNSAINEPGGTVNFVRWSCGYTLGNFSSATISMSRTSGSGAPASIAVTKETYSTGAGDNTVVWRMNTPTDILAPTPGQDISYSVVISGITLTSGSPPAGFVSTDGGTYSYTYSVTTFDPSYLPTAMTVTSAGGSAYTLNPLPEASNLRLRSALVGASTTAFEGAEDAPTPKIIDGISGYTLRSTSYKATGSKSFYLTIPTINSSPQYFIMDRDILLSATSQISFKHRFRAVSLITTLRAELSTDGGTTWTSIWSRTGDANSNSGSSANFETAFNLKEIPPAELTAYLGKPLRLRFSLGFTPPGTIWVGTTAFYGAYVDDVQITNCQEMSSITTTSLLPATTSILFSPTAAGTYVLQSQMEMGSTKWFDYGPVTTVVAAAPTALQTWRNTHFGLLASSSLAGDTADSDGDGHSNLVEYVFGRNPKLAEAPVATLPAVTKSGNNLVYTFTPTIAAGPLSYTVEKSGTLQPGSWTAVAPVIAGGVYTATIPIAASPNSTFVRLRVTNHSEIVQAAMASPP